MRRAALRARMAAALAAALATTAGVTACSGGAAPTGITSDFFIPHYKPVILNPTTGAVVKS